MELPWLPRLGDERRGENGASQATQERTSVHQSLLWPLVWVVRNLALNAPFPRWEGKRHTKERLMETGGVR